MTYEDLTSEQREVLQVYLRELRPAAIQFAASAHRASLLGASYGTQVESILSLLDAGAEIPNTTNLAGAEGLLKEEVEELSGDVQDIGDAFSSPEKQAIYLKACGLNALFGD
jgi:hypothetical protein